MILCLLAKVINIILLNFVTKKIIVVFITSRIGFNANEKKL